MVSVLETREERRGRLAMAVRAASDVTLPHLDAWNYGPCEAHDTPRPDCEFRACGGDLFRHQRVGVAFLYLRSAILADQTGLGKTNQLLALMCLMKQKGELKDRALVVCQASAVGQWVAETQRFAPGLRVVQATGERQKRLHAYSQDFDVCVISYHVMLRDRDLLLRLAPFSLLCDDDVDPIRHTETKTARAYNRLALEAGRVVNINATPLQIHLQELYATSISVGGMDVFGSARQFERNYVRTEPVTIYIGQRGTRGGRKVVRQKTVGYRNLKEFKEKIAPLYIRRRYEDVDDVRIPDIAPVENVWLELHAPQRARYAELQQGVLKMLAGPKPQIKRVEALAKITYGAEICAGFPALGEPDGPEASVKLDWLMERLQGDWVDEKVVVFSRFKGTIRALHERCGLAGIGYATIWGEEVSPEARQREIRRFWDDRTCRVIVGTSAIERSLNLQNAHIVVNYDTLLNPARMTQILGRVRRVGSQAAHVFVVNLLCLDTQEAHYLAVLERRQALADYVWSESSQLYESLNPMQLLRLIQP